ncbi:potassium-transporting ATPase subunit KdpA [Alkalimonas sp. MEB108]|uniref:Potassium-transporting ATPase potassium-binding subunit n=1 Tax=Alkalimonas cellulosilytica TaxID=3058395 RepID=A0ABU7J4C9_9GAMM|nr:potassium-transporting ATPase subunit KdpA [Alkalimonas sp. MEB108]MEE2001349.1 potassium-transporting ATPase subunit KdpA [Alkalimonas sp. MEB108]
MLEVSTIILLTLALAWPLSRYMAGVFNQSPHFSDRLFLPLESLLYTLLGVQASQGMTWQVYAKAFLLTNLMFGILAFLILKFQHILPLNPDGIGALSWDLALHTAVSFLTNTNQQHYSGQAQLTYLSQGTLIVTLQFLTPAMGLAACLAILRAMSGGRNHQSAKEGEPRDLGNFYVDTTRAVFRVLMPIAFVLSLLLVWQGTPSTFQGAAMATTLDPATEVVQQEIPRGPAAAMIAIKQLGTNGGGYFGPNSSNPYENPTPLSNVLQLIAIWLIPIALVLMAGSVLRSRSFSAMAFVVMGVLSLSLITATIYSERQQNAALADLSHPGSNMEGKEFRFGSDTSALWATLTTQTSNGSVNAMHDSLNPIAGLTTRAGMLINAIWGGIGSGLINFIVYVWVAVFLAGLLTGRTPELLGRKLETKEISLLGGLVVLPAAVILVLTAVTVAFPSLTGNTNPGFHGISQVFYEYTSAFANNGSGFEGLDDDTPWWNLSAVLTLLLGRYLPIILPLAVAGMMASKRVSQQSSNAITLSSLTFCITLVVVILMLNFLSFLPSAVLGPIGEGLELAVIGKESF